jgi:hypothetical protein
LNQKSKHNIKTKTLEIMSNYFKLYLLTRLDGIIGLSIFLSIILLCAGAVIMIGSPMSKSFDEFYSGDRLVKRVALRDMFLSKLKFIFPFGLLFIILSIFIPTKNEAIFIVAGGKTIDFIQTDTSLCKIPEQTTQIVSAFLDDQIREINSGK